MEPLRKPFQGIRNIVWFNLHVYLLALFLLLFLLFLGWFAPALLLLLPVAVTLIASWYIYDRSGLYDMDWAGLPLNGGVIVNIHAGFDETSILLQERVARGRLMVFDFYDPSRPAEVCIERARRAYPPYPGTQTIDITAFPMPDGVVDQVYITLSAHEIRDAAKRTAFFSEIQRVLKHNGQAFVTEHLRDVPNFLIYNIGFLHFISRASWLAAFKKAGLRVAVEKKLNPFITTFVLEK